MCVNLRFERQRRKKPRCEPNLYSLILVLSSSAESDYVGLPKYIPPQRTNTERSGGVMGQASPKKSKKEKKMREANKKSTPSSSTCHLVTLNSTSLSLDDDRSTQGSDTSSQLSQGDQLRAMDGYLEFDPSTIVYESSDASSEAESANTRSISESAAGAPRKKGTIKRSMTRVGLKMRPAKKNDQEIPQLSLSQSVERAELLPPPSPANSFIARERLHSRAQRTLSGDTGELTLYALKSKTTLFPELNSCTIVEAPARHIFQPLMCRQLQLGS